MHSLVIFLHLVISLLLIVVILMQSSKGGGLAGAFGGDSMGAVFGGRGVATFLSKVTTVLAVLFVLSCVTQVLISKTQNAGRQSLTQQELNQSPGTSPAASLPGLPVDQAAQNITSPVVPDTSK